ESIEGKAEVGSSCDLEEVGGASVQRISPGVQRPCRRIIEKTSMRLVEWVREQHASLFERLPDASEKEPARERWFDLFLEELCTLEPIPTSGMSCECLRAVGVVEAPARIDIGVRHEGALAVAFDHEQLARTR